MATTRSELQRRNSLSLKKEEKQMKMNRSLMKAIAAGAATLLSLGLLSGCASASNDDANGGDKALKVGISVAAGQNATLQAVVAGLEAELSTFDAELISADANLNVDKQIADIDSFVNQGLDAIVIIPLDYATLSSAVKRADDAGIPVFLSDAIVGEGATIEEVAPAVTQVRTARPADAVAEFITDRTDGKGVFGTITIAAPVAQVIYFVDEVTKNLIGGGMTAAGEAKGNPSDDAAGARPLAEAMLTQHPNDLTAIFAYNDPSAIGASAAATAAGKRDQVTITGFNASTDGLKAIEDGTIDATWDYRAPDQGQLLGRLIKAVVIDGKTLNPDYPVDSTIVTKENVKEFISWEKRVELIGQGKFDGISVD